MVKTFRRSFRIGAIVHQDYEELALRLTELEDRLNKHIDLTKYTDLVEKIYFVPILLSEENENHEEESWYDEAERKVFLRVKCDLDDLAGVEAETFLKHVGASFLRELEKMEVLPEALMEDLHQLLASEEEEE
jgi:hypothetical protein